MKLLIFLSPFGKFPHSPLQINKVGATLHMKRWGEGGWCTHEHKKSLKGQVTSHSVLWYKHSSDESLLKYRISHIRVTRLFNSLMYPLDVTVTAQ